MFSPVVITTDAIEQKITTGMNFMKYPVAFMNNRLRSLKAVIIDFAFDEAAAVPQRKASIISCIMFPSKNGRIKLSGISPVIAAANDGIAAL